ncbi:MAG: TfoX/Sxy family DNA transformation protein [Halocynthiibacter sp.]
MTHDQLSDEADKVSSIRNLGPASDTAFGRAGIHTATALRAMAPDDAYLKLLQSGSRPHFIGYYAMIMGLQGRPWNDCKGKEKDALLLRFNAIKKRAKTDPAATLSGIERALDEIGVIDVKKGA